MKWKQLIAIGAATLITTAVTLPASAASVTDFVDVSSGAWYYNAVNYAASNGLFAGTSATIFSPETPMTRGMFVTVLGRKNGVKKEKYATSRFTDVKADDWYGPYVEWAAENSIVSGTGNGKFTPNESISRQQMATILYRYAQQTGNDTTADPAIFNGFPDTASVSDYAKQGMTWAVSHGIIKGSGGKLDPTGTATRAQVAQVFLNANDILVNTEIAPPVVPHVELTPEQKGWLTPDQDPDEVLRQVLAGTAAKWDPTIDIETSFKDSCIMYFGDTTDGMFTTKHAVYNTLETLNDTGADRFYIAAGLWEGEPSRKLKLYYTVPDKADSDLMREVRRLVEKEFPNAKFCKNAIRYGHGWRGYVRADSELSLAENAQRVANTEIRYLSEWYGKAEEITYWISEPEPGKFYFFY